MKIIYMCVANRLSISKTCSILRFGGNNMKRHENCLSFLKYIERGFSQSKLIFCNRLQTEELNVEHEGLKVNSKMDNSLLKKVEMDVPVPSDNFLTNLCFEDRLRIETAVTELKDCKRSGRTIPSQISDYHWNAIIELTSTMRRLVFYRYLVIKELRNNRKIQRKAEKRLLTEEYRKERKKKAKVEPFDGLEYGLSKNCLFLNLTSATQTKVYDSRLCQASMFGQKLVLDLSYSDCMSRKEYVNCAVQLSDVYSANRRDRQPFDLHFCNVKKNMAYHECLLNAMPYLYSSSCFLNVTDKSYMEHFPKEKLVYLSPHSEECMTEFDFDAIYIIGALVDKSRAIPISLIKAEKYKIKTARFPLEQYLNWGAGNKSLPLQQVIRIMLDIKNTGDWNKAFRHIPSKYLKSNGFKNS